jgi:hypothetical protein
LSSTLYPLPSTPTPSLTACADAKKDTKQSLNLAILLYTWNILLSVAIAVAVAVAVAVTKARTPLFSLLVSKMTILEIFSLFLIKFI